MAKKIIGSLKLQVKAGQANPSPPVGPALGQRGLNIMAFVKEFNAKTADITPGTPTTKSRPPSSNKNRPSWRISGTRPKVEPVPSRPWHPAQWAM